MYKTRIPEEYEIIKRIDFEKKCREAKIVNVISCVLLIVMIAVGGYFFGAGQLEEILTSSDTVHMKGFALRVLTICVLCGIYVILHELIHLVFMRLFCRKAKLSLRYRVVYANAGSNGLYSRWEYALIALSPIFILGVILTVGCVLVSKQWLWPLYMIQALNIAGAAGDLFVLALIARMPREVLIRDSGNAVTIYGIR